MFTWKTAQTKVDSWNANHGLTGGLSGNNMSGNNNLLDSNWTVFQGSWFRTHQNINLSQGNIAAGNA